MSTVFSHIIQKRFSRMNEDVATDALAYILESSEAARRGMQKLLRGVVPDLPPLRFRTQQAEGSIRPDMWGFVEADPRVFVENKFWAGLTDNQPVSCLNRLATCPQSTVLLVVAPAANRHCRERAVSLTVPETSVGSQLALRCQSLYIIPRLMGNSPKVCKTHCTALLPELLLSALEFV